MRGLRVAEDVYGKMMLKFGSLFSGVGGFDLGFERAGMACKWQVEIDDYCRRVLAKHWPNVPRYGDIKELTGEELEPVDVICGGFPCQPVSLAGKRLGQSDERWLWPEFYRVVCTVRPRFVIVENVSGLLSDGLEYVLGDLAASGYDAEWQSIPASAFGAPHIRERIWIVAYPVSIGWNQRQIFSVHSGKSISKWTSGDKKINPNNHAWNGDSATSKLQAIARNVGMVDGVPARVDRLRALGNAVVPQVAEWLGRRIVECTEA